MNEQNYASLEASQRLVDAGIVLETETVWFFSTTGWELVQRYAQHPVNRHYCPAPSMAEAWRELPERVNNMTLKVRKSGDNTEVCYDSHGPYVLKVNTNFADALIDLLIWVRKEGNNGNR